MAAAARHMVEEPPTRGRLTLRGMLLRLMLLAGVCLMLYPAVYRLVFEVRSMLQTSSYVRQVETQPAVDMQGEWDRATAYNATHRENVILDPFGEATAEDAAAPTQLADEYFSLLNPLGTGVMGYIDIPRIGQRLNIYHGTDALSLQLGVGHLRGTSLPVGGEGTHCVLSGHRGLPTAKLFTDLDRLSPGDLIYLHILDQVLAYEVDGSQEVLPTQVDSLEIVEGRDVLTLLTCTPYAVNTHRLLVHAHRVPYVPEADDGATSAVMSVLVRVSVIVVVIALALVVASGRLHRD